MPKTKTKKPAGVRRSRKGYVMIELSRDQRIALNWLLARQEKLLGEKQQAAPFLRQMLWGLFVSGGGLKELSEESPLGGLDAVKTAPYTKGVT